MATTHLGTGLYVDDTLNLTVRRDLPIPKPAADEILVEMLYSGATPADTKHATQLDIRPAVLGYDFLGKVLKIARQCHRFHPGETVAGYTPTGLTRTTKYGTHQSYLACPEKMAFRVPAALPFPDAAALTVDVMTAADALFNLFGIPLPQEESRSVGLCAVQLARASGVSPILMTASPQRHALPTELGATRCFDYRSPHGIEESDTIVAYGTDAVGSVPQTEDFSATLLVRCLAPEADLVSLVVQDAPRFCVPIATPNRDVTVRVVKVRPINISARPADFERAWRVLEWAIRGYGVRFRLPRDEVFGESTEDALEELMGLAEGGRRLGKVVLRHPLA
ncbi:alcohol dehydrogenase [Aspergillus brunneoviolaceus CBS 621.78]|uniref:Alcohol dehydrogenase n=1 Tax=Aspergillus brunneoviolaceus CBS 621.78 TaxID=1450534 RepID=A0ACD1GHW7_9EURO|nr:alcohol dehydrogenase [Aspergillus brunneoviolaceus CBS 621.78]RAH48818.1 alcohol dehydrogenase [Aspergillus brunneoviolaceus CBS 621.78]